MSLLITDDLVKATRLSEAELRMEFAVLMYQQDRLTLGQASHFAGVSQQAMQKVLGSRMIPVHYGLDDLEEDLELINQRRPR
jgi:predicted HTH domain antitoxin